VERSAALEVDAMEVVGDKDREREERDAAEYRQQLEGDREMRKNVRPSALPAPSLPIPG
jgi:hypothetical protein